LELIPTHGDGPAARAGRRAEARQGASPEHRPSALPADQHPAPLSFSNQAKRQTKRERKMLQTRSNLRQANWLFKFLSFLIILVLLVKNPICSQQMILKTHPSNAGTQLGDASSEHQRE